MHTAQHYMAAFGHHNLSLEQSQLIVDDTRVSTSSLFPEDFTPTAQ